MSTPTQQQTFPGDWQRALVVVAHPDDPEYGMAAAVNRWTREGKEVDYLLASSGEAGIEGMDPSKAGPVREEEQRRSARVVGVSRVDFLGFPDSAIENSAELRRHIIDALTERRPQVVLTLYRGPEWAPGQPNQSDHTELGNAVVQAIGESGISVQAFENGPYPTHRVEVTEDDVEAAVRSLAEHTEYLGVLDPSTPVPEQARTQVGRMVQTANDGTHSVGLAKIDT